MKSRLNLYTQELQPEREFPSLVLVVKVVAFLICVLTLVGAFLHYRLNSLQEKHANWQQQVNTQQQTVEQLRRALGQKEPSADLVSEHVALSTTVEQKRMLLAFIEQEQKKTTIKFGAAMAHLADIDPAGFWLTEFSFSPRSSAFKGYTLKADCLPAWLEKLSEHAFFQGQNFSGFEIQPSEQDSEVLFFVVESKPSAVIGGAK